MAGVSFAVQVDGMPELKRRINGLSAELRVRAVRVALRAAARPVAEEARRLAPVSNETGKRRRARGKSWGIMYGGKLRKEIIARTSVKNGRAEVGIGPSWSAYYGMFPELGTRDQPAQPFLRPALDNRKEQAVTAFRDVLRRVIDKYAERAGIA